MIARALATSGVAAMLLCGSACGGSNTGLREAPGDTAALLGPPEDFIGARPFFLPGERMSFELSLRGVVAGEAIISVGDPGQLDDKNVIIVRSRSQSVGVGKLFKEVHDEVTTWVDLDTALPIRHEADLVFGAKHVVVSTKFGTGPFVLEYQKNDEAERRVRQTLPPELHAYDGHAALGALRAWEPEASGARGFLYALSGRRLWKSTVRFVAREEVRTQLGVFPALRFEGLAWRLERDGRIDRKHRPRRWSLWMSDDLDRLPLLVVSTSRFGEVTAELTDYVRPDDAPAIVHR